MDPKSLGYDGLATQYSKNACFAFLVVCAFIAIFKPWGFGIWWIAVLPVGLFAASLAVMPLVLIEWSAHKQDKKLEAVLASMTHTIGIYPASYYSLKTISYWIH